MPIERLENRLGRDGDAFVRAIRDAVEIVPQVRFARISVDHEVVEDSLWVRVTLPTTARGYRKVFHAMQPFDLRRNLEHYLRKKYGAPA